MSAANDATGPIDHDGARCAHSGRCQECVGESHALAVRIPMPITHVLQDLVTLERPAAVTTNELVRVTQVGRYVSPSMPDEPIGWRSGCITLRVDPALVRSAHVTTTQSQGSYAAAMRLVAAGNIPAHQCHALIEDDTKALYAFADATLPQEPSDESSSTFGSARSLDDQLGRLDTLLTETRAPFVPHAHIPAGSVMTLLFAALADDLPLGIGVFSVGVLQATQGTLRSVTGDLDALAVETDDAVVELAVRRVANVIVTASSGPLGPTSMIELYDRAHSCVAVISQFGLIEPNDHAAWERLVDSLPELG